MRKVKKAYMSINIGIPKILCGTLWFKLGSRPTQMVT